MVKIKEGEGMNKKLLLLVSLMGGVLEAARPGEEEGGGGGGSSSGQAARDAAQLARELAEQAARDAAGKKPPKRGGWANPKGGGGQQQSGGQGGQQRGGGQGGRAPVLKGGGSGVDGDAAAQLSREARTVVEDPFGNLDETSTSATTTRTALRAPVVSAEDVARKAVEEGAAELKKRAEEFIFLGTKGRKEFNRQAEALEAEGGRFERVGESSPVLERTAREASEMVGLVGDRPVSEIDVSQGSGGLNISAGGKSVTVREITMSFVPKNIFRKIMFCWRRSNLKSALRKATYQDRDKFAEQIAERKGIAYSNVNSKRDAQRDFIEKHLDAGVGLDWEDYLVKK